MSIAAVGACYVDTILTTSHYPQEDEKLRASTLSRRRGGNCPNTLEVLQQLIPPTSSEEEPLLNLIAVLPARSSVASQKIVDELKPQVQLTHCIYREQLEEPASSYIIKSQSTGSRTIVNYNELPEMTVGEFSRIADDLEPRVKWFHFEGRIPEVTLGCIQYIRSKCPSTLVSVEVEKPGRPGLQELAQAADVVFYSKTWASLLCCTWGQDGAAAFKPSTDQFVHSKPETTEDFIVVEYVNCQAQGNSLLISYSSVGAGDTFIAGMLYALNLQHKKWDLPTQLQFANKLAATKVSQEGFSGLGRVLVPT
ncbi:hypothetical protein N7492_001971 [Penicillium capsulatum]|uniref:Carbohydrate kinase PfkB domain-containing protein n=1 Tax=Penicillium capsulatum TaxID=69766 RepID=A0A9W9IKI9_9EURO|nr:hypothetical protein N7492_001971 [Penicillium capsulatum]